MKKTSKFLCCWFISLDVDEAVAVAGNINVAIDVNCMKRRNINLLVQTASTCLYCSLTNLFFQIPIFRNNLLLILVYIGTKEYRRVSVVFHRLCSYERKVLKEQIIN